MSVDTLTDETISQLISEPKLVQNKRKRSARKLQHEERNYVVVSKDGKNSYTLIIRQSLVKSSDYSCGLMLNVKNSQNIMLVRYNGEGHPHTNPLEREKFECKCHIHRATERYIKAGRKAELYAEMTDRYRNSLEALKCLLIDCNISEFPEKLDMKQMDLK